MTNVFIFREYVSRNFHINKKPLALNCIKGFEFYITNTAEELVLSAAPA